MDNDASRMISNQLTCDTSRVAYTVPPVPNLILPRLPAERSCIHTPIVVRVQPGRGVPPPSITTSRPSLGALNTGPSDVRYGAPLRTGAATVAKTNSVSMWSATCTAFAIAAAEDCIDLTSHTPLDRHRPRLQVPSRRPDAARPRGRSWAALYATAADLDRLCPRAAVG